MRSRLILAAVLVTALLVPAAAPWCATPDDDRMPCCKNGVRCDLGMRASDCCGVTPTPATPRAPVALAATPSIERHHDGTGLPIAAMDGILRAPGVATGTAPAAGPPRARTTPLHILNTSLLC